MGYYVEMELEDVVILAENVDATRQALLSLVDKQDLMGGGAYHLALNMKDAKAIAAQVGGPAKFEEREDGQVAVKTYHFSWVAPYGEQDDICQIIKKWRYLAHKDTNGDIYITDFNGEKLGDDKTFWKAIAPYVASGSTITCRGEDDYRWRWVFQGGEIHELQGRIVWY